ncbi:molybdopterin/thiamine biosynthesis adenylyltransferase [Anaerosolibacter carboniphilus]|uniref:Molybdopterin/thiamine biosynthesis adenylyltransferase n=1 Tax=Anaerosolibacter carboniphilus TaxID=1417629 RepID=A0A841KY04_9FIRM|nr:HesA/MoeB/ThiF family protein [Anaerosolibacter carboniphilus]MBB6215802.1 molybdopterin/thiamine biosynthesis adenylyltransferase [Anaerosolibacter carboniphilus]
MVKRYERNMATLSLAENENLQTFKVCVVGCGGLGGYLIEMLGRLGIGSITAVDGDHFDETNLNRQLLSDVASLGVPKAAKAQERMKLVNPFINVNPILQRLTPENGREILQGHHLVMDALDNIPSRMTVQAVAEELNIPMIHGAIAGWYGQITTILPGDRTLSHIYPVDSVKGIEQTLGNPSFTPALVASIQVSEGLKVLIGRGELLRRKILYLNLLDNEYEVINL